MLAAMKPSHRDQFRIFKEATRLAQRRGLEFVHLADALGVSSQTLWNWRAGNTKAHPMFVQRYKHLCATLEPHTTTTKQRGA